MAEGSKKGFGRVADSTRNSSAHVVVVTRTRAVTSIAPLPALYQEHRSSDPAVPFIVSLPFMVGVSGDFEAGRRSLTGLGSCAVNASAGSGRFFRPAPARHADASEGTSRSGSQW